MSTSLREHVFSLSDSKATVSAISFQLDCGIRRDKERQHPPVSRSTGKVRQAECTGNTKLNLVPASLPRSAQSRPSCA